MNKYSVSKQYGHFVQIWNVTAESEKDAWEKAESEGNLVFQTLYKDICPMRNYVTNLDTGSKEDSISQETYVRWLKEAMELGMKVDGYCGLPFTDV